MGFLQKLLYHFKKEQNKQTKIYILKLLLNLDLIVAQPLITQNTQ